MPTKVIVTDELANKLWYAQAALVHEMTEFIEGPLPGSKTPWNDLAGGRTSDDPGDYWCAAIDLFHIMFDMRWDEDPIPDLTAFLNAPQDYDVSELTLPSGRRVVPLWQMASDGIANAFYELDCPALPKEH